MEQLPDVVLFEVFAKLTFVDLCACSRVCHRWYELTHSQGLRKKLVVARFLSQRQLQQLVQRHLHNGLEVFELKNNHSSLLHVKKSTIYKLRNKSPKLKRLVLSGCALDFISCEDLPPAIRYLSVRGSELNIFRFFSSHFHLHVPFLTCLDVSCVSNFFTSEDLYHFSNFQNLRCLYLEGCFRINSGGLESIVDILPHLYVLDIEATDVLNEGVRIIFDYCINIKELYLGHLDVDDDALSNYSIDRFLHLTTLCVKKTRITQRGIQKFLNNRGKRVNVLTESKAVLDRNFVPDSSSYLNFCKHYESHSCTC